MFKIYPDGMVVSEFYFYSDNSIQTGAMIGNQFFQLLHTFNRKQRDQAFDAALTLFEQKIEILITVSEFQYRLWKRLRSEPN